MYKRQVILSASNELIDYCHETLGSVDRESGLCIIPAHTYKGQENDAAAVVTAGELTVNKDVSDEVVYTILKAVSYTHLDVYKRQVPWYEFICNYGYSPFYNGWRTHE